MSSDIGKHLVLGGYTSSIGLGYYTGNNIEYTPISRISSTLENSVDYLIEMETTFDSNVECKITKLSDSTVIFNATAVIPFDITDYYFTIWYWANVTATYREIKVSPV